jgi:integrase
MNTTLRPRSYVRYEEAVRLHVLPTLARVALAKLTPQQVQHLYTTKLHEGQAPSSVARLHAVLHKALADAERMGLVQRNVASLVNAPRPGHKEQHALTPEQVRTLFAAAEGHPLEAFFVVAATAGLRRGELLALHWSDVDLEERMLHVRYTLEHTKGGKYIFAPPKTKRSERKVRLGELAVAALRRHRARQVEQHLAVGPAWDDHDLVFTDAVGQPLRGNHILQRQFTPLLNLAGLPSIRLHDLRHTAATLMGKQGIPVAAVSEMLGHSSTSMTLDIYSHAFPDMQREAASALDRLLGSSAPATGASDASARM